MPEADEKVSFFLNQPAMSAHTISFAIRPGKMIIPPLTLPLQEGIYCQYPTSISIAEIMDGQPTAKSLKWFPTPGILTDPGEKSHFFSDLPDEIETLCQVIQNNLIHILWAERYGRELSETEKETVNIRFVDKK